MRRVIPIVFLLIASCGSVTQEELNRRLSGIEDRINKLEEMQKRLEEQSIRTDMRVDNLAESLTKLRLDVERLKTGREITIPQKQTEQPPKEREQVKLPPSPQVVQEDYQKEYDEAVSLYNQKDLQGAKNKFIEFIRKNPKTPLTDNAYFWLGVTYRDLNELDKAEAVWLTLVERCKRGELPDCNKAPSAYIQLARLYESRGDEKKAREMYERIIKEYPLSEEAELAKKRLER